MEKKKGGKEKTCLTSPEGRVVATKFKKKKKKKQERKYARRETHKDVTKISEYQKLKTKKRQKNNNKRSEKL